MKTKDFNFLCDLVTKKLIELDLAFNDHRFNDAYVLLSWWTHEYRPMIDIDATSYSENGYDKNGVLNPRSALIIFDETNVQMIGDDNPCSFCINTKACDESHVIHHTKKFSRLQNNGFIDDFEDVKFLVCANPLNQKVEIDPWRTRIVVNRNNEVFVVFHIEDGKFEDTSRMNISNIKVIIDGKYASQ